MRNKIDIRTVSYDFVVNFNVLYKCVVNSASMTSETRSSPRGYLSRAEPNCFYFP